MDVWEKAVRIWRELSSLEVELLVLLHFTTVGPRVSAFLGAIVGSVGE